MRKYFVFHLFIGFLMVTAVVTNAAELKVSSALPQGPLNGIWEAEQITISFDKPVVELRQLADPQPDWFVITPEVEGTFQWLGTQTIVFKPNKQLPLATSFKVRIKSGLLALDGSALNKDFIWTFQTPVPFVQYTYPHNSEKSIDTKTTITVYFNIPVQPDAVLNYLDLYENPGTNQQHKIDYEINQRRPEASVKIELKPLQQLRKDTQYKIQVRSGLPAAEGHLGSTRVWSSTFRTYSKFELISVNDGNLQDVNPKGALRFKFSNPVDYSELIYMTTFAPVIKKAESDYSYQQSVLTLYGPFLPDTSYQVVISGKLKDIFGNELGNDVVLTVTTRSYDPQYKIPTGESIVESYGDLNIPIEVVNLNKLSAKIKFIPFDSVDVLGRWFLRQSNYSRSDIAGGVYDREESVEFIIKKNIRHIFPFQLKQYLPKSRSGVLFIQFHSQQKEEDYSAYKLMMTQVTDLGVSAKFSPVSNGIYVTKLRDGKPVRDALVQIRDGSGKVYWEGRTDTQGYCESPGWQRLNMPASKEREPVQWAVVKVGDQYGYTHSERGTGISPWEFRIPYEWQPRDEKLDGAIFTDRGIYRAEDTVRVKVVLREKYGLEWRLTERDSFQVMIDDPVGSEFYLKTHALNEFNSFDFNVPIPYDAKRGHYGIQVNLPQKLSWDTSLYASFRVEDYRPAEFEVTVKAQQPEYIFGDTLEASISADYLFGAPLKNAPLKWTISKTHAYPEPPGWEGFYFHPEDDYYGKTGGLGKFNEQHVSRNAKLNKNGSFRLKFPLSEPNLSTCATYTVEGEVTDEDKRRISGQQAVLIYRGEYQVGVRPKSFFGTKNKVYPIEVVTVNRDGELLANRQVELKIIRRNWYSVKKAGVGGRYIWRSEVFDSTIVEHELKTKHSVISYDFLPKQSGFYLLRATSRDGRGNIIVADCRFYILGSDYVAWERNDDDRIELEINKPNYKPGETATVMIKSPFETATALVTIEREGIIDHFVTKAAGSTPTIDIPIRDIYLPNVYVSVMLIQGRSGDNMYSESGEDIGKPAFKLGYINLPVATDNKKMTIDISTDKQVYRPRERVSLTVNVKNSVGVGKKSELIVAVVDKGVLNLTGYRFTNLHDYFYRNQPLSVTTSESRLNIIGQRNYGEKGEDVGGGGTMGAMSFMTRENFKATTYWNPSVVTDGNGNASLTFQLPDNLTTFVVMVAAHNKASEFGNDEHSFKVNQPLLLKPALPRFLRFEDKFEAGVVVHNYSEDDADITVYSECTGVRLLDNSSQKKTQLPAGESQIVLFKFEAHQAGAATFTFKATMGSETDAVKKKRSVHVPLSYEVVAISDNSTKSIVEKIIVPQDCHSDMSVLEIKTAATQLSGISDGVTYLYEYPYGCLEQKISRILPMILFEDVLMAFDLPALADKDYRREVQDIFDHLIDYQGATGGFRYWQQSGRPNPYVSAWAVFSMIKGMEKGYKINKDVQQKATAYLDGVLKSRINKDLYPYTWNYWAVTNCLILYDLALLNQVDHGYIEKYYQQSERIPLFGKTYLLKAMKLGGTKQLMYDEVKQSILNGLRETPTTAHFEEPIETGLEWCFHSNVRTTAHILQAMVELKEDFPAAPKVVKWLITKRNMEGHWRNTQENIFVLHALNSYFQRYEKQEPDFKLNVKLAGQKLSEAIFQGYSLDQQIISQGLDSFDEGKTLDLKIDKKGDGRYYYETRMKYFPKDGAVARDAGLSVIKKWDVVEGNQTTDGEITAGSVVKITLTVATSMERNYVVLDDPLPAGFEAINTRLKTVSDRYQQYKPLKLGGNYWGGFNFYEIRDDRIVVFADNLPAGVHDFVYLCHALTTGEFVMPGTKVEEMYTPEVFGKTGDTKIIIR